MDRDDILIFIFWFLLVSIFAKAFYNRIIVVIHIHKYEGRVKGKIISIREATHCYRFSVVRSYYPTYQYVVDGTVYEVEIPLGLKLENFYHLGQESLLYYDEKHPKKFVIPDEEEMWKRESIKGAIFFLFMLTLFMYVFLKQ